LKTNNYVPKIKFFCSVLFCSVLFLFSINAKAVSITVTNGETKTINSTTIFQDNEFILVEPGGVLILDGATLTTLDPTTIWAGITILGTGDQNDQPDVNNILSGTTTAHGVLIMKNGSVIENAQIGVNIPGIYSDPATGIETDQDGGIAIIDGFIGSNQMNRFSNNGIDVYIKNSLYPTDSNAAISSYIANTEFHKTNPNPNNQPTLQQVSLINLRKFVIKNNIFRGERIQLDVIPNIRGINSEHSTLIVEDNIFEEMSQGIYAVGTYLDLFFNPPPGVPYSMIFTEEPSIYIDNHFDNVEAGIFIDVSFQDIIERNTFDYTTHRGYYNIFVLANEGVDIANNVTVAANSYSSINDKTYGIVADLSDAGGAMFNIRENQLKNTNFGLYIFDPKTNLQVTCNQFGYDGNPHADAAWQIVGGGSLSQQGGCNPDNLDLLPNPAGNEWNYGLIDDDTQQDIVIDGSIGGTTMFYAHHTAQPGHFTEPRNLPDMSKIECDDPINNSQCSNLMNATGGGPIPVPNSLFISFSELLQFSVVDWEIIKIEGTGGKAGKVQELESIRASISVIESQLDNGYTFELVNAVQEINSQTQLTQTLNTVEHLSTEVQKEVIDRADPLSSKKLREVFIPQAPLQQEIITDLENRSVPVATAVLEDIKNAHLQSTKVNLISLRADEQQLLQEIKRLDILLATIFRLQKDEVGLVNHLNNSFFVTSKISLAKYHINRGNWTEARQALTDLESIATVEEWNEYAFYVDLLTLLIDLNENSRNIYSMTNEEVATVQAVVDAKEPGYVLADIILHKRQGKDYYPTIPRLVQSNGKRPYVPEELETVTAIALSPNPATNFVTIENPLLESAVLILYDTQGRTFYSKSLEKASVVDMEVMDWHNGAYFYTIITENGARQTGKLMIVH